MSLEEQNHVKEYNNPEKLKGFLNRLKGVAFKIQEMFSKTITLENLRKYKKRILFFLSCFIKRWLQNSFYCKTRV